MRFVAAFVSAILSVLVMAPPAHAASVPSPYTVTDERGDVSPAKADVLSMRVAHKSTIVRFSFTTRRGSDPALWINGTQAGWSLDLDNDGRIDHQLNLMKWYGSLRWFFFVPGTADLSASRVGARGLGCGEGGGAHPRPEVFQVTIPRSCLGNPSRFGVAFSFYWVTPNVQVGDYAPLELTPPIRVQNS